MDQFNVIHEAAQQGLPGRDAAGIHYGALVHLYPDPTGGSAQ